MFSVQYIRQQVQRRAGMGTTLFPPVGTPVLMPMGTPVLTSIGTAVLIQVSTPLFPHPLLKTVNVRTGSDRLRLIADTDLCRAAGRDRHSEGDFTSLPFPFA